MTRASEAPPDAPQKPGYAVEVTGEGIDERLAEVYPNGLPNIYRMLSRNPQVMGGLLSMKAHLAAGRLSEIERSLVALEVAHHSGCKYCEAALCHSATEELGVPETMLAHAGTAELPADPGLAAIVRAARALLEKRGQLGRAEMAEFARKGVDFDKILEIIGVISEYTLATYSANLDRTRIDPEYRQS
ncbi:MULTISPECIES: carboxymuconolactone decarboxylase family protein [unclassified Rhodosalinus]|uniref:carboxymuconolactone decarboxylase family protein n=1 Tax=unclassified Rhodosalinus TaxID=2630183 RepID=UPI0035268330